MVQWLLCGTVTKGHAISILSLLENTTVWYVLVFVAGPVDATGLRGTVGSLGSGLPWFPRAG